MNRLYVIALRVSQIAAWFGGTLLLFSASLITVDVILRKILNVSIGGSDEIAGYILAISTSWGLCFALIGRANIRIDALYTHLPQKMRAWLDLLGLVMMGVFMAFVSWFAFDLWRGSVDMGSTANTPLQTPLMIPQAIWVAGFAVFMLVLLVLLIRVIGLLMTGDISAVMQTAGIRTVEEEVSDEVSAEALSKVRKDMHHVV